LKKINFLPKISVKPSLFAVPVQSILLLQVYTKNFESESLLDQEDVKSTIARLAAAGDIAVDKPANQDTAKLKIDRLGNATARKRRISHEKPFDYPGKVHAKGEQTDQTDTKKPERRSGIFRIHGIRPLARENLPKADRPSAESPADAMLGSLKDADMPDIIKCSSVANSPSVRFDDAIVSAPANVTAKLAEASVNSVAGKEDVYLFSTFVERGASVRISDRSPTASNPVAVSKSATVAKSSKRRSSKLRSKRRKSDIPFQMPNGLLEFPRDPNGRFVSYLPGRTGRRKSSFKQTNGSATTIGTGTDDALKIIKSEPGLSGASEAGIDHAGTEDTAERPSGLGRPQRKRKLPARLSDADFLQDCTSGLFKRRKSADMLIETPQNLKLKIKPEPHWNNLSVVPHVNTQPEIPVSYLNVHPVESESVRKRGRKPKRLSDSDCSFSGEPKSDRKRVSMKAALVPRKHLLMPLISAAADSTTGIIADYDQKGCSRKLFYSAIDSVPVSNSRTPSEVKSEKRVDVQKSKSKKSLKKQTSAEKVPVTYGSPAKIKIEDIDFLAGLESADPGYSSQQDATSAVVTTTEGLGEEMESHSPIPQVPVRRIIP
jgi:hypothetical protein